MITKTKHIENYVKIRKEYFVPVEGLMNYMINTNSDEKGAKIVFGMLIPYHFATIPVYAIGKLMNSIPKRNLEKAVV